MPVLPIPGAARIRCLENVLDAAHGFIEGEPLGVVVQWLNLRLRSMSDVRDLKDTLCRSKFSKLQE